MARKGKGTQQKLNDILNSVTGQLGDEYSIGCILINKKASEIGYMQDAKMPAMYHIAALIGSCVEAGTLDCILNEIPADCLEVLRDYIDSYLESSEEEEVSSHPCCTCSRFCNKGFNFGTCRYEEGDFDGEREIKCEKYKPKDND